MGVDKEVSGLEDKALVDKVRLGEMVGQYVITIAQRRHYSRK